ncbi:hypothetical protein SDC9_169232 [bioreactor metagenome]|uniref:Uncharacterized protein n=1 Tax=bioreactor metagenome TaxID=1076179 RepID=A0A645G793_9ZZZZ
MQRLQRGGQRVVRGGQGGVEVAVGQGSGQVARLPHTVDIKLEPLPQLTKAGRQPLLIEVCIFRVVNRITQEIKQLSCNRIHNNRPPFAHAASGGMFQPPSPPGTP